MKVAKISGPKANKKFQLKSSNREGGDLDDLTSKGTPLSQSPTPEKQNPDAIL